MILLLDNYDSFTYNLFQALAELGAEVEVVRNDKITVDEIEARLDEFSGIVADSTPEGEYQESLHKMRALVRAIEKAERMEASGTVGMKEVSA